MELPGAGSRAAVTFFPPIDVPGAERIVRIKVKILAICMECCLSNGARRRGLPRQLLVLLAAWCAAAHTEEPPVNNPELASLVERAIATHPSGAAARAEVAAAESQFRGARLSRLPGVSMESFADQNAGGRFVTALAVEQPIWSGGRIRAGIRQSESRLDAARARLDEISLELAVRAVEAYVSVQMQQRRAEVLERSLDEHRRLVESMQRRVDQQISPASDLELARSRSRQTEIDAIAARAGAEVALLRLRQLVGDDRVEVRARLRVPDDLPSFSPSEVVESAVAFDPRRRRTEAEAEVAATEVALSKSELMPQIGARYVYHLGNTELDDRLGLTVRVQTGGGFSRLAAIDAARELERAARLAVDTVVLEQRETALAVLAENLAARQRVAAGLEAELAAQSVTESFLRQFAAGRRTWPEVLNAVRETVAAELARVDAESNAVTSYLRLLLISGAWRPGRPGASEDEP